MQTTNGSSKLPAHIEALLARHAMLEQKIFEEMKHPGARGEVIRRMKSEKLRLKERIEGERQSA